MPGTNPGAIHLLRDVGGLGIYRVPFLTLSAGEEENQGNSQPNSSENADDDTHYSASTQR